MVVPDLLSCYYRLPSTLKNYFASIRGYQFRWLRYSNNSNGLIEQASQRELWNSDEWQRWEQERLAYILHRAATKVPYYRKHWSTRRKNGERASREYLENWPILEKETVRKDPEAFVSEDVNKRGLYIDQTGGTTGKPTLVYESRRTIIQWFAIFEARTRRWYGVNYKQRWANFGGKKIIPLYQKKPPYWVINRGLNQIYFSVFHIQKETASSYVDALRKFSPTHMIVYPSSVAVLARHILEQNLDPPQIKVVFSNSEVLFDHQRGLIEAAFKCPVVDTYGMAELVSGASECEQGTMHYWPEIGYLESIDRDTGQFVTNSNETGEFVFTSLLNEDMPLIRYRIGDVGVLPNWKTSCRCGRKLPIFGKIKGRANDLILTPDGRELYLLDSLYNGLPLAEAQLIQDSIQELTVRLVPNSEYDLQKDSRLLKDRLLKYLGDVNIQIEFVSRIPRGDNGKFRPYISRVRT